VDGLALVELARPPDRLIWFPRDALAKLRHLRRPGESFSDVILRLADEPL
jgi:predicted CopG family antitoxin